MARQSLHPRPNPPVRPRYMILRGRGGHHIIIILLFHVLVSPMDEDVFEGPRPSPLLHESGLSQVLQSRLSKIQDSTVRF